MVLTNFMSAEIPIVIVSGYTRQQITSFIFIDSFNTIETLCPALI